MADSRNIVTAASVAIAVVAGAWAIYVTTTKHEPVAESSAGVPSRAERQRAQGAAGQAVAASGGARSALGGSVAVFTAVVKTERLTSSISALGTARANEAVEVTSKISNTVTAVRFTDGQRVREGQVLVELDSAQARADLAAAEAASAESASQVKRSRELINTRIISEA